jgi:hypothetical protein
MRSALDIAVSEAFGPQNAKGAILAQMAAGARGDLMSVLDEFELQFYRSE